MKPSFQGMFSVWADNYIDCDAIEDKKDEAMKLETEIPKAEKQFNELVFAVSKEFNGTWKSWIKENLALSTYRTLLPRQKVGELQDTKT